MTEFIPITQNLLIKSGFEDYDAYYRYGDFIIHFINGKFIYGYTGEDVECTMEYVHQLQNLFFSLKGEEIEIKIN